MKKYSRTFLAAILTCALLVGMVSPLAVFAQTEPAAQVQSWNLLLADEIAANFWVDIPEQLIADGVMYVTDGYGTSAYPVAQAHKNEDGLYKFTARMAASQLTKPVKLELVAGGETVLEEQYRAVDYANIVLAGDYNAETKALLKAMLHYGAAAQTYFGRDTDHLANAGLAAPVVEVPQWVNRDLVSGNVSGVQCYAATLVLRSRVAVRFYFRAEDVAGVDFGGYTPVEKNGLYYVEIPGINPQNYDKDISLTVTDGNSEMTVTYSPMDYILRKYASADSALKDLTAAMYGYYEAAKAYVDMSGSVITDGNGIVVEQVIIRDGMSSALVAAGTQLEAGVTELVLTTDQIADSQAKVELAADETLTSVDVHVEGIAKDNTVPVIVTLDQLAPEALNQGNIAMYHVENGETIKMTRVFSMAELDAHNEFYYDIATGTVSVALCSFSEVAVQSAPAVWQGEVDHSWYKSDATELYIYNADQLWSFSQIVGGMAENGVQDSFEGKTVILHADIDLGDDEAHNVADKIFYPIGYYYIADKNGDGNTSDPYSTVYSFEGVFDGNGHTVKNFYQNTWEMTGDNSHYDTAVNHYYNDGMGLFGYVYGGTVKNLNVDHFSCDGEFTPTGTIAAYACNATFENIAITNCNPRVYNTGNGGIVGIGGNDADPDSYKLTFNNITVDNSNKISALWGSWDVACGGLVGMFRGAGHAYMTNCHLAAQIDVNNDVCGNYQYYWYRYAGMVIGTNKTMVTDANGYTVPETSKYHATDCTVHFGDWNDYYYCELVANTLASYTHDHQFSRLELISDISEIQENGVWTKTGHFMLNSDTCYHIYKDAEGNLYEHKHEDSGEEEVNGQVVLKENNQRVYLPFNQLFTGYGWGVKHIPVYNGEDYAFEGITILDRVVADSLTKFTPVVQENAWFADGQMVTVDRLFAAADLADDKLVIDNDNVQVFVSPADENSTVSGEYDNNVVDWKKGTLTFSGTGYAYVTISDYNFCEPTTIKVLVSQAEAGFAETIDRSALKNAYTFAIPDAFKGQVVGVYNETGIAFTSEEVTIGAESITLSVGALDKILALDERTYGDCVIFLTTVDGSQVALDHIYAVTVAVVTKMIGSYEDLYSIKDYQYHNAIDGYFALSNDFDATGKEPICLVDFADPINGDTSEEDKMDNNVGFRGIFDGRGHTISNLTTKNGGYARVGGLFGQILQNAVVRNVAFMDMTTDGANNYNYLLVGESCRMMGRMENVVISAKGDVEYAFGFIGCDTSKTAYATRFTMKDVVVSGVDYLAFSIKYPNRLDNVIVVADRDVVKEISASGEDQAATEKVIHYNTNAALFTALESDNAIARWEDSHISYENRAIYFNGKAIILDAAVSIQQTQIVVGSSLDLTVTGDVTIALKEDISGVSLSGNTLTVADSVKEGTRITVVATNTDGVTKEFVVVCHRNYTDAVWGGMDAQVNTASEPLSIAGINGNAECLSYGIFTVYEGYSVSDGMLIISKDLVNAIHKEFGLGEHTIYLGTDANYRYAIHLTIATKLIYTVEDLEAISTTEATLDGYFVLNADLNFAGREPLALLAGAQSTYGSANIPGVGFKGTFDGRGHVISNLITMNGGYRQLGGVFGQLCAGSVVKNVAFVNLTSEKPYLLVGDGSILHGTLENVVVISADNTKIPLTELRNASGKISNCFFANVKQISTSGGSAKVSNVLSVTTNYASNYGGFSWTGNATYNAQPNYATMDALYAALDANNILASWENALLTYENGKLYFNGTPLIFENAAQSEPVSLGDLQSSCQNVIDLPASISGNVIGVGIADSGRLSDGVHCVDGKLIVSQELSERIAAGAEGTEVLFKLYTDEGICYNVSAFAVTKIITNQADLQTLAVYETMDGYYVLANDIQCDGTTQINISCWTSQTTSGFTGIFDGRGHAVMDVNVGTSGIFNGIGAGTVKNVAFVNVISSNNKCALSQDIQGATIENVFVSSNATGMVSGGYNGTTLKNVVFVSEDAANGQLVPSIDHGTLTATNVFFTGYRVGYMGANNAKVEATNVQYFAGVEALLTAIGADGELVQWTGSPFSFVEGKLYFGNTAVIE